MSHFQAIREGRATNSDAAWKLRYRKSIEAAIAAIQAEIDDYSAREQERLSFIHQFKSVKGVLKKRPTA